MIEVIDSLVEDCEEKVKDEDFSKAEDMFPHNTPKTKEAFYFRTIFEEYYPNCERVSEFWIPNTDWEGVNADPSGRAQGVHDQFDETF